MNFEGKPSPKINTLENHHLKDGFKPIIAGVYNRHDLDRDTEYFLDDFKRHAEFINYEGKKESFEKSEILNSGENTYLISPCDSKDKYSLGYLNCTGVVVVGFDKNTKENISFLSHENPEALGLERTAFNKFKEDMISRLKELKDRSVSGSVDIVLFGGNKDLDIYNNFVDDDFIDYSNDTEQVKDIYDEYRSLIISLNNVIKNEFGFSPVVIHGPNTNFETGNSGLSVYFDNKNRRLYLLRPKNNSVNNEEFIADNLEDQIKKINASK